MKVTWLKQKQFKAQTWTPTRGSDLSASEQLVAQALTEAGIEWAYEDRFLPTSEQEGVLRGMCPDYRIKSTESYPEQYLEVTTAKQATAKRRRARQAAQIHATSVTVLDRIALDLIASDSRQILRYLQPA